MRGKRFPIKLKGVVYKSCIRPVILYRSEARCLNESEMEFYDAEIRGESNVWSTVQRCKKELRI